MGMDEKTPNWKGLDNVFDFVIDKKPSNKPVDLLSLYDTIVIGGGPGGANAALYAKRKGLDVLLVTSETGGQVLDTNLIENYLGMISVTGEKLNSLFIEHLDSINIPILNNTTVKNISKIDDLFNITLDSKKNLLSKSVILATGAIPRKLRVQGEDKFYGNGVSYCAICDGPFYKNKDVVVVGGGNSALETVIDLAKIVKSVKVIQLESSFTADQVLVDRVKTLSNVSYSLNSSVKEFIGNNKLERLKYINNLTNEEHIIEVSGAFIQIGIIPNSKFIKDLVKLNNYGQVITDIHQRTSLEGVYAVGDLTDFPYKQIITAASQGAVAALSLNDYLNRKDNKKWKNY